MNAVLLIGLVFAASLGQEPAAAQDVANWSTYENAEYGYSIRFPDGYDGWPTGPVGQRDGRSIRIGRSEYAAPTPVMDIHLRPEALCSDPLSDIESNDMESDVVDVDVNGDPAREVTLRWRENGEIVFVDLCVRDALVQFHAAPGLTDFQDTIWWTILSTLEFQAE